MNLTDIVCWTKIQSEAGESLNQIIMRKEAERQANQGVFLWGVGTAPSRELITLVRRNTPIQVVFSKMKSAPRNVDSSTTDILRWRAYLNHGGEVIPIPPSIVVTSKSKAGPHYALICQSESPLVFQNLGVWNHNSYCNIGPKASSIGSSQVTALVRRRDIEQHDTPYQINMMALLHGAGWVRLADPIEHKTSGISND